MITGDVPNKEEHNVVRDSANHPQAMEDDAVEEDTPEKKASKAVKQYKVDDVFLCPVQAGQLPIMEAKVVAVGKDSDQGDYYVHFVDKDRRLDRWVQKSEIIAKSGPPEGASDGAKNSHESLLKKDGSGQDGEVEAKLTRSRKRLQEQLNPVSEKEQGSEYIEKMERAREEKTKIKNFTTVYFAPYEIGVWYFSPYTVSPSHDLFVCPACLKYTAKVSVYQRHVTVCTWTTPPGARIYFDMNRGVSVYEVDGLVNAPYCQRLCLLAKLFLDHKTLYFDVAPFLFYVVTTTSSDVSLMGAGGAFGREELSGFFSKEKSLVSSEYNLACILTLPPHQRKGLGRFMIALSYELTRREGKTGGPERPLSDLGQVSYRAYWNHAIVKFMRRKRGALNVSVDEVAKETGIRNADVVACLKAFNMLNIWKREMYVNSSSKAVDEAAKKVTEPRLPLIKSLLKWGDPSKIPKNKSFLGALEDSAGKARKATPSRHPASSPSKRPRRSVKGGLVVGAFSEDELAEMRNFVKQYGAERVMAPMNTKDGIPSSAVRELAQSMNMSTERCRKKLKRISIQAIDSGLDLYPADNRFSGLSMSPPSFSDVRDSVSSVRGDHGGNEQNGYSPMEEVEDVALEDDFDRGRISSSPVDEDVLNDEMHDAGEKV